MQNKKLYEEILSLKETDHICAQIILNYRIKNKIKVDDFKFVYVVYGIQDHQPLVFNLIFMSAFEEGPPVSFESYLQQIKTSSFSELLYLVSYFGFFKKDEANLSLIKNSLTKGSLDCYFENTFGKLLYHYQLEQLFCSLTKSTSIEAIAFRKSINLKRHNFLEKSKRIFLPTGESLFDVLTNYRLRNFTLYPKIKETMDLYNYFNPNTTNAHY